MSPGPVADKCWLGGRLHAGAPAHHGTGW